MAHPQKYRTPDTGHFFLLPTVLKTSRHFTMHFHDNLHKLIAWHHVEKSTATDMSHTVGSGRLSRNSQGIYGPTLLPTTIPRTLVQETPVNTTAVLHTPDTNPLA